MSRATNEKLREYYVWFAEHRRDGTNGDVTNRVKFLETALDGAFDVISRLAEDVSKLEGRPPESLGRTLWLPTGIKMRGDVRRVGV